MSKDKDTSVKMRNLRTLVPPETFLTLEAEAQAHGVTLAAWVRIVLIRHTVSGNKPQPMSTWAWEHVSEWFRAHGHDMAQLNFKSKQQALAWARENGYDR